MKKALVIIACVVMSSLLFGYYKLGGFKKPEHSKITANDYWIYGKHYKGKLEDKNFATLFEEAEAYISSNNIDGYGAAYYFNNPQQGSDTADAFVGFIVEDSLATPPQGYNVLKIDSREVVQMHMKSHYIVSPINVYESILEYAEGEGIKTKDSPSLEIYRATDDLIIQVPVIEE
ncbi:GyrI-like domain-containing protein [Cytophagaceae bacterium ABcell3]|nr:GyrI-like domain-containing protein [Cytophagaceae bacterium ABcell3]